MLFQPLNNWNSGVMQQLIWWGIVKNLSHRSCTINEYKFKIVIGKSDYVALRNSFEFSTFRFLSCPNRCGEFSRLHYILLTDLKKWK